MCVCVCVFVCVCDACFMISWGWQAAWYLCVDTHPVLWEIDNAPCHERCMWTALLCLIISFCCPERCTLITLPCPEICMQTLK